MRAARTSYRTFVVERDLPASRERVWEALMSLTGAGEGMVQRRVDGERLSEELCSLEPPWRLVTRLAGSPALRYGQLSVTLRDDGPRCLGVWSYLVEPEPGEDPAERLEALARVLEDEADAIVGALA